MCYVTHSTITQKLFVTVHDPVGVVPGLVCGGWDETFWRRIATVRLRSAAFESRRSELHVRQASPVYSKLFLFCHKLRRRNFFLVLSLVVSFFSSPLSPLKAGLFVPTPIMAASYLRSTTMPLSGLKRLAAKPSVSTACLVARRTKASLAQDGQQQVRRSPIGNDMRFMLTGIDSFLRRIWRRPTRLFLTSSKKSVFLITLGWNRAAIVTHAEPWSRRKTDRSISSTSFRQKTSLPKLC